MTLLAPPPETATLAARFGVSADRVRAEPFPGTATEEDVLRVREEEGVLCELVDGTLVEKAVSEETSVVAARLIWLLTNVVEEHDLGWVLAPDGYVRLFGGTLLRAPDVSVVLDEQRPNGLATRGYSDGAPALCVEVVSPSNRRAEIDRKRGEYFANGCRLVWVVRPRRRTVEVFGPSGLLRTLREDDVLTGDSVVPQFAARVSKILRRGG